MNASQTALRLLYKSGANKKKPKKNFYPIKYPKAIENRYANMIAGWYEPLVSAVRGYLKEYGEEMLRGDRMDAVPGGRWRELVKSVNAWMSVYMPTVEEIGEGTNSAVFIGMDGEAENTLAQVLGQFQSETERGIGVRFSTEKPWWNELKENWVRVNYELITGGAREYAGKIATISEQAVVNGWSVSQLAGEIMKAGEGITEKKARLIARDQIGKLQGQIQQAQMGELGLELYVWETAGDERVRGNPGGRYPFAKPSHYVMDGLLCRWDDASVCSRNGGKTWERRPANAPDVHPGQAIQCRCVALAWMPELFHEASGETMTPKPVEEPAAREELTETAREIYGKLSGTLDDELAYAVAAGNYEPVFETVGKMNGERFGELVLEIGKKLNDFYPEQKVMVTSQLEIARKLYRGGKNAPNFSVTASEFEAYKQFLKAGAINSYDEIASKYGYEKLLGFAREFGFNGAGLKSYYAGINGAMELKNDGFRKLIWEQMTEKNRFYPYGEMEFGLRETDAALTRCRNIELAKDFRVADVVGIRETPGSIWGTAEADNLNYVSIAMFDNEIKPFDKKTQKLVSGEKFKVGGNVVQNGLEMRKYAQNQYSLERKLSGRKQELDGAKFSYRTDEFMRMEFTWGDGEAREYKPGDVLEQTGVFATSPSERHNWKWTGMKLEQGAHNPVRFHLARNETSQKYLTMVQRNDMFFDSADDQPDEFTFSIGKVRVVRVEDGVIGGVGGNKDYVKEKFNVKEVYVEIVE